MKKTFAVLALCTAVLLTACADDTGSDDDPGSLPISFGIASSATTATTTVRALASRQAAPALTIDGTNGTLEITHIAVIVKKFELKPVEVAECDDIEPTPETCVDVEQRYFFIDVPVDGTQVLVVDADVPAGTYEKLKLKIDDIDVDDDDPEEVANADAIAALFADVRNAFPDWPEDASMVVEGTFTPTGGTPVPFTTYFEAKIKVKLDFPTPLVVPDDTTDGIQVALHPAVWFTQAEGTVQDLSQWQDQVVDFKLKLKDGFELKVDWKEDDD